MEQSFFYCMPRGQLTKDQMKYHILKLKQELYNQKLSYTSDPKALVDQYLNMVLDKINEYAN